MNRYMTIPLAVSLACFTTVFLVQSKSNPSTESTFFNSLAHSIRTTRVVQVEEKPNEKLSFAQAKTLLLEAWPVHRDRDIQSRAAPRRRSAWVQRPLHEISDEQTSIHTSLTAMDPEDNHSTFAIHVDRVSHEIKIFNGRAWDDYSVWLEQNLATYEPKAAQSDSQPSRLSKR